MTQSTSERCIVGFLLRMAAFGPHFLLAPRGPFLFEEGSRWKKAYSSARAD
jgi:hypothetical protein